MKETQPFSKEELWTGDFLGMERSAQLEIKRRQTDVNQNGIVTVVSLPDPAVTPIYGNTALAVPFIITVDSGTTPTFNVAKGVVLDQLLPAQGTTGYVDTPIPVPPTPVGTLTEQFYGAERTEIVSAENVTYDTDAVNFSNTINAIDVNSNSTPFSTGNISISLPGTTLGTPYFFYIVGFQTVDLNNLNTYFVGPGVVPQPKYITETESGILKYPYKRNGYAIFVSTIAPTNGVLPVVGNFDHFFELGQQYGTDAFFIGYVVGKGPTAVYTSADVILQDSTYKRKVLLQDPRTVEVQAPTTLRGAAIPDPTITQSGEYALGSITTLEKFVKAIGSGTPAYNNPLGLNALDINAVGTVDFARHRREEHSFGIITDNAQSTNSALLPQWSNASKQLSFYKLSASAPVESAYSGGNLFQKADLSVTPALPSGLSDVSSATQHIIQFTTPPTTASATYLFFIDASGHVNVTSVALVGTSPTYTTNFSAVLTTLTALESLATGRGCPIAVISWDANTGTLFDFVDLRVFGSISHLDIQASAVTGDKIDFSARAANQATFSQSTTSPNTTIVIANSLNVAGTIPYSMSGFYSRWLGGFCKQGTNSVFAKNLRDTFCVNADATPSASVVSDLDAGSAQTDNWYGVFAVKESGVSNLYKLKLVTFLKVGNISGQELIASKHNVSGISAITYGWTPTTSYVRAQAMCLTGVGTAQGKLFNIIDNDISSITVDDPSHGVVTGDYLMLSPAQTLATTSPNFDPNSFRYLGAIYVNASGNIRAFTRQGDTTDFAPILVNSVNINADVCLDGPSSVSVVPPTSIQVAGSGGLVFAFSASGGNSGVIYPHVIANANQTIGNTTPAYQNFYLDPYALGIGSSNVSAGFGATGSTVMPFPLTNLSTPNYLRINNTEADYVWLSKFRE